MSFQATTTAPTGPDVEAAETPHRPRRSLRRRHAGGLDATDLQELRIPVRRGSENDVFAPDINAGNLHAKYDVLVFNNEAIGRRRRARWPRRWRRSRRWRRRCGGRGAASGRRRAGGAARRRRGGWRAARGARWWRRRWRRRTWRRRPDGGRRRRSSASVPGDSGEVREAPGRDQRGRHRGAEAVRRRTAARSSRSAARRTARFRCSACRSPIR